MKRFLFSVVSFALSLPLAGCALPDLPALEDSGDGGDSGAKSHMDSGSDRKDDSGPNGRGDSESSARDDSGNAAGDGKIGGDSGAGCVIDGTTYASGATNPTNACESCQPSVGASDWTDATDGIGCSNGDICHVGACVSGCEIAGAFEMADAVNPNNQCQSCQPGKSVTAWSSISDGTGCGNGQVCSSGECGTQCEITGMVYASAAANPLNSCQSCQPGTSTTAWSSVADGTSCAPGEVCSAASCMSGCYIAGTFYASAAANPADACESCEPSTSTTEWTGENGTTCGTGKVCSGANCESGCYISGTVYAAAAANPSSACQSCQPATSTTQWTDLNGTTCGSGKVCSGTTCESGCYISGTFYAAATVNPGNGCQSCVPATSTTTWTNAANSTTCGNGQICNSGACGTQCDIGGTVYGSAVVNPVNACQSCQPGTSTSAWSNLNGASCGSGEVCNGASCGAGCFINGTVYAAATVNTANPCQSCVPTTNTTQWTSSNGISCGSGKVCGGATCESGCYINGTVYAAGIGNPSNSCQSCQPTVITTGWSNTNGASCGSGEVCGGSTCQAGCYINGTIYAPAAVNPSNSCQSCQPASNTAGWSSLNGGSCNGSGTCGSGSCVMPPSCAGTTGAGTTVCGSMSDSCCTSLEVTDSAAGGLYSRTYTYGDPSTYADPATVSGFRLDKYIVTVGRFRQFVAAWKKGYAPGAGTGKHTHLNGGKGLVNAGTPGIYEGGWDATDWNNTTDVNPTDTNLSTCGISPYDTWTTASGSNENLPINCVNWYESYAFCIWDGGFLPSEAEWEYAAVGGNLQSEYPWGETDPGSASQFAIFAQMYNANPTQMSPPGTALFGAGNWGQFDLAGEVLEWTLDWSAPYTACTDCAAVTAGPTFRVYRGSDFNTYDLSTTQTGRFSGIPNTTRTVSNGFRCARTP